MKTILAVLITLVAVLPATACYECGQIVQRQTYYPVVEQVQYRLIQPQVIRETIQLERQTIERDPVIVERQEKVIQYQVQPQLQLQHQHQYAAAQKVRVQRVQVQQVEVQKVQVQPVIIQKQVIQKQQVQHYGSQTIIQQSTQRPGLIGRILGPKNTTTIINR